MIAMTTPTRFEPSLADIQQANVDSRLWLIRRLVQQLEGAIANAPPAALFSQTVQELVRQIQHVARCDRLEVLRDMIGGRETRLSREYRHLTSTMKLIFWYRLSGWRPQELGHPPSQPAQRARLEQLLDHFAEMDSNQQFYYLRQLLEVLSPTPSCA